MNKSEIIDSLDKMGLDNKGSKEALLRRLHVATEVACLSVANLKDELSSRGMKSTGIKADLFKRFVFFRELEETTLPTLKDICSSRGLLITGTKKQLIERIVTAAEVKEEGKEAGAAASSSAKKKRKAKAGNAFDSEETKASSPKKLKKAAPSVTKAGLAGLGAASLTAGEIDVSALVHSQLAGATLKIDARLALVEPAINSDKYYILQFIESTGGQSWVWSRWGRTGHAGQGKLAGPLSHDAATVEFEKIFHSKTGVTYSDALSGAAVKIDGKYEWLATAGGTIGAQGTWEYYVDDNTDGKTSGWYPYSEEGNKSTENLYHQYVVCGNSGLGIRFVQSGHFTYRVDLTDATNFSQKNIGVAPYKERKIRRIVNGLPM